MLTNGNCSGLMDVADAWDVDETSVSLVAMPLFHIGGSGWANVALARGGTDVLVPMIDPAGLIDTIEKAGITNAFLVPAVLQMMCAVPGADDRDYSSLRSIAYGASPITDRGAEAVARGVQGAAVPGLRPHRDAPARSPSCRRRPRPGRPAPAPAALGGQALPVGGDEGRRPGHRPRTAGRARSARSGPARAQNSPGYWGKPEDTAAAFDADGWLHTGDAGYLDDEGFVFLTDRIKDMIVTGAENVYPIEVESALSEHPDVADVAVIGVPDERWGETVKAVVVRRPGSTLTEDELLEWARDRMAGFKRPRSVDFADELPRNPSGKLLKRVLREPYWSDADGRRIG